jgi:hypothetical protein
MALPNRMVEETDPRFPSGLWAGFFIQPWIPGRHTMDLDMSFHNGLLEAEGTDRVGPFTFTGTYNAADGQCRWTKKYLGKHRVSYAGVNEGKGIWGVWEIRLLGGWYHDRGVFHLWPEGMAPAADADLTERALLDQVGRRPPLSVAVGMVVGGLLLAGLVWFRLFGRQWIESLLR